MPTAEVLDPVQLYNLLRAFAGKLTELLHSAEDIHKQKILECVYVLVERDSKGFVKGSIFLKTRHFIVQ